MKLINSNTEDAHKGWDTYKQSTARASCQHAIGQIDKP